MHKSRNQHSKFPLETTKPKFPVETPHPSDPPKRKAKFQPLPFSQKEIQNLFTLNTTNENYEANPYIKCLMSVLKRPRQIIILRLMYEHPVQETGEFQGDLYPWSAKELKEKIEYLFNALEKKRRASPTPMPPIQRIPLTGQGISRDLHHLILARLIEKHPPLPKHLPSLSMFKQPHYYRVCTDSTHYRFACFFASMAYHLYTKLPSEREADVSTGNLFHYERPNQ